MVDTDEVYIIDTRRSTGNHCCCLLGQTSYLSLERQSTRKEGMVCILVHNSQVADHYNEVFHYNTITSATG